MGEDELAIGLICSPLVIKPQHLPHLHVLHVLPYIHVSTIPDMPRQGGATLLTTDVASTLPPPDPERMGQKRKRKEGREQEGKEEGENRRPFKAL